MESFQCMFQLATLLKKSSVLGVLVWLLKKNSQQLLWRTLVIDCLWRNSLWNRKWNQLVLMFICSFNKMHGFFDFKTPWNNRRATQTLALRPLILKLPQEVLLCSCYGTVPSAIWEIFSEFLIFCEIIPKYEKRGKYLPILHMATCDNCFSVKRLLKSIVSRIILLSNCIELA